MKAATAVALARAESARRGIPVLPLFWNGSDDSDFDEASGQWLARPGRAPVEIALPSRLQVKGRPVGELSPGEAFADLERLAKPPFRPEVGEDLGHFHARVLAEFFAEDGLLILEARAPAIGRAALPLYRRYQTERKRIAAVVDAEGDRLEISLGERPLREGIGERALFFLKDGRRRLPSLGKYESALARRLNAEDPQLSPNVLLRPLVQSGLLPVEAVVLGPSEWRYHHQIRPVFDLLEIPFPRPFPRLDALEAGELGRELPPPGGRHHSPLLEPGNELGAPAPLLALAQVHLEAWGKNLYYQWIMERSEMS